MYISIIVIVIFKDIIILYHNMNTIIEKSKNKFNDIFSYDNLVVNHIDKNRLNNNYKNLEWCSASDNTKKYFENKKNIITKKPKKIIAQIDIKTGNILNRFNRYIDACDHLKISKSSANSISYCCKGYRQTANGYKWKIINE